MIRDHSGELLTPERLLAVVEPYFFVILDDFPAIYELIVGCQPRPNGVNVRDFNQLLARMKGFKCWTPQFSGTDMFKMVTEWKLESMIVVTDSGVTKMTDNMVRDMVQKWVRDLCAFVAEGDRVELLLDMATRCRNAYRSKCDIDRYGNLNDPGYLNAKEILTSNEHNSRLVFGIYDYELLYLYKYLAFIVSRDANTSTLTKDYLGQLAVRLRNRPQ
ncbi:hypothetical protein H4R27_004032 [Coemansia aciculifera]|nr:hypothetical protein H4R27_004032 [Coemansia aciculifera]